MERDYRPSYRDDRNNGRQNYPQQGARMNSKPSFWNPENTAKLNELIPQHTKDGEIDFASIAVILGSTSHACLNKFTAINEPVWTELQTLQLSEKWTSTNGKVAWEELLQVLTPHSLHGIKMKLEQVIRERKLVPTFRLNSTTSISVVYEIKELCENAIASKRLDIVDKLGELQAQLKALLQ